MPKVEVYHYCTYGLSKQEAQAIFKHPHALKFSEHHNLNMPPREVDYVMFNKKYKLFKTNLENISLAKSLVLGFQSFLKPLESRSIPI